MKRSIDVYKRQEPTSPNLANVPENYDQGARDSLLILWSDEVLNKYFSTDTLKNFKEYDTPFFTCLLYTSIMDLSSHGDTQPFRRKLTAECPAMIGTVPVYDSVIHYQRDLDTLSARDFIDVIRLHAQDGVDFVCLLYTSRCV